ncbi:ribonuclease III [Bradyrhizobium arachidis]|uniref:ribonuclease III n=1 Tax=Bradyrhizobium TaxID=374 RepID=UPI00188AD7EF|nr:MULTISPECIES: ribonuclease III [Bradyrhizobium]MDN4989005.1 ribonuclease III [Bradyrhizobium sp. WYCCWR 13022]QOZ52828.1 ribonuclease III [Bradyrhizobium sp. CCBAU 53338]UVO39947.1 ribonuclease III [Bradyrhizobium arachidis]
MKDEAKDITTQPIEAQAAPEGEAATKTLAPKTPEAKAGEHKAGEAKTADAKTAAKKKRTRSSKAKDKAKAAADANAALEARIGHGFADPNLLMQAITHVSALKSGRKRGDSYQRLEFLGDHVLGLVVSDMLYHAFPNADEGELSKRLAELVRKESCADVAKSLGLLDDIKLGSVGSSADARLRKSILGDICEAVIGAIFLDGGHAAADEFVKRNWTERMHKPRRPLRDPKTVLQEWAQGKGLPTPVYREVERTGPHHDPQFRVAVDLPGLAPAEGIGGSKRAAEKVAASVMIEREGVGGGNDG